MRKIVRLIGYLLLAMLTVMVATLLFFWINNQVYIGGAEETIVAYLTENQKDISEARGHTDWFDPDFYNNRVFLLGENHGSADIQFVDLQLLLHLNQKIGVRYYIAEMDSTWANNLNKYLANPQQDTTLLKQIVQAVGRRIPQQASQGLFDKWSEIHKYNKSLADSLKITVIGLDKSLEDTSSLISRDSMMLLNFKSAIKSNHLENEQFYGLFGYTHVLQSGVFQENFTPFAAKLKNSNLPFTKAVKSIVCYNLDSEKRLPTTEQFPGPPDEKTRLLNADGPIVMVKGIKDLQEATKENTITLFNLEAANSPYKTSQKLARVKVNFFGKDILPHNESQPTTEFFQYVVLSRNSKALTRVE